MTTNISTLTRASAIERLVAIQAAMEPIGSKHRASRSEEVQWAELSDEFDALSRHVEKLDRAAQIASVAGSGGGQLRLERGGSGGNERERLGGGQRDAAMRTIDGLVSANQLPARAAETVEQLTKTGTGVEQSWAQRVIAATGDDAYYRAFCRVMADPPQRGHLLWDAQEQQAFQRVESLRHEMRSMNTTDDQGGFLAPLIVDPSIQISSAGNINPIRKLARNVQTISDSWHGITSAGVTAHWLAEEAEVSDDSPTLAEETISVYTGSGLRTSQF